LTEHADAAIRKRAADQDRTIADLRHVVDTDRTIGSGARASASPEAPEGGEPEADDKEKP
jgi:hypothetical protein